MPIFTNKHNLPTPVVQAILNDPYTKGGADYSVTELLKPPQMVALERRHQEKLEVDVVERFYVLLGKAMHHVLEMGNKESQAISEKRIHIPAQGVTVSGAFDLYLENAIFDYKLVGVYSIMNGIKKEWEEQLNLYRLFAHKAKSIPEYAAQFKDVDVNELNIVALLRDWTQGKADAKTGYPDIPIKVLPVKVWDLEDAEYFLNERVALHKVAGQIPDTQLPLSHPCSAEDRWYNGKTGKAMRCANYCSVGKNGFCHQFGFDPVLEGEEVA